MDDSSEEEVIPKTEPKPLTIQLKPSLDNSSQNEDDDIYFSTNCLLKMKTDYKSSVQLAKKKKLFDSDDVDFKKIYSIQTMHKNQTLKRVVKFYPQSRLHSWLKI
jgi:hypothetical protein